MKSKFLLVAALGLGVMPASAQDVPTAVTRCASVKDDSARLACYDGIAAGLKQAAAAQPVAPPVVATLPSPVAPPASPPLATSPAVPPPVAAVPPPVAAKVAAFGADTMPKPEQGGDAPKEVDEIKGTITEVAFSPSARFIVTLDNGQVWRQIEGDSTKARFHKSGDAVTISRGVLSGYNLTLDGSDLRLFKVRRVR